MSSAALLSDPVAAAADSLRSQLSALGKQLGGTYCTTEPGLIRSFSTHSTHGPAHPVGTQPHGRSTLTSQYSSPSHAGTLRGTSAWQAFSTQPLPASTAAQYQRYVPSARSTGPSHIPSRAAASPQHRQDLGTMRQGSPGPILTSQYETVRPPPAPAQLRHTPYTPGMYSAHATQPHPHAWSTQPASLHPRDSMHLTPNPSWVAPDLHAAMHAPPQHAGSLHSSAGMLQHVTSAATLAGMAAKEESRLKEMLQEVRHERRRLEDKILEGDSKGVRLQELRDELEKQVGALSRQRDLLEAETGGMMTARDTAMAADQEVVLLQQALMVEQQQVDLLQSVRLEMDAKLSELATSLDQLASQHTQAVAGLTSERDTLSAKHVKIVGKLTKAEGDVAALRFEVEALRKELHGRELSLTEVRASAEVLQTASTQMQAQLSSGKRELEGRCLELTRQLEEARQEATQTHTAAQQSQQALQEATTQLKESLTRSDFLRTERDKLLKTLKGEQSTVAELRKQLEAVTAQVVASEAARAQLEAASRQQVEDLHREHDTRMAAVTRQFEAQLVAAERAASAAAKQHDSRVHTGEKLLEVHASLRRERDQLWNQLEGLKTELVSTQQERDQLASKVALLRAEVKSTIDDVRGDRDAKLHASAQQHDLQVSQLRMQYERQAAATASEHEAQVSELMEVVTRLREELSEAQRTADKYRSTACKLRDQLAEALVLRDNLEREVIQERQYGEELSRLVAEMKAATRDLR